MGTMQSRGWLAAFGAILLLGTALRFVACDFGRPSASVRPDEELILRESTALADGDRVRFHNYPPGLIYLQEAAIRGGRLLGLLPQDAAAAWARDPLPFHLLGRWISALLGSLTVLVVGLTGWRLHGAAGGILAAGVIAVSPLHVLHSHFATVDAPGTFLVALSFFFALRRQVPDLRLLLLSALAAGVAAGFKYPMGLAGIVPLTAALACHRRGRTVIAVLLAGLAGFLLASPTWLTHPGEVWQALAGEADSQSGRRALISWAEILRQHWHVTALGGIGAVNLLLMGPGLLFMIRGRPHTLPLALFALFLTLFNLTLGVPYARYFVPLIPVAALSIASLPGCAGRLRNTAPILVAALILIQGIPAWRTWGVVAMMKRKDTRGALLEAFDRGELPRDLPLLIPGYPFLDFSWSHRLDYQTVPPSLPAPRNRRDAIQQHVLESIAKTPARPTTLVLDESTQDKVSLPHLLQQGPVLVVVPQTPPLEAAWLTFPYMNQIVLPRLREAETAGKLKLTLLLDLDPRIRGHFAPPEDYEGFDYWFVSLRHPYSVKQPGPRLRVFRVDPVR